MVSNFRARDMAAGTLSLRLADGEQVNGLAKVDMLAKLRQEIDTKSQVSVFKS